MAKDLEEALTNIEKKLGGTKKPHMDLGEHLEYIESLIGGGSSSLPDIEEGDAGKTVKVKEDETGYELGTISSGTKLYKHVFRALYMSVSGNYGTGYFICDYPGDLSQAPNGTVVSVVSTTYFNVSGSKYIYASDNPTLTITNGKVSIGLLDIKELTYSQLFFISDTVIPL